MTYRESIIPKAVEAYAKMDKARRVSKVLFIHISEWTGGPKPITGTEYFYNIDDAACRAADDEDYCGTVAVSPNSYPMMLDLRDHGYAIKQENDEYEAAERAWEKEKQERFNER